MSIGRCKKFHQPLQKITYWPSSVSPLFFILEKSRQQLSCKVVQHLQGLSNFITKFHSMKKWFLFSLLLAPFLSCDPDPEPLTPQTRQVEGLKPIYVSESEAKTIKTLPPKPIVQLGKIYYKDATIYVNESNFGVHIIDNTNPANPVKKQFLQIPGCRDIAIKGNFLYADNIGDLIVIDITDLDNPKVMKRLPGIQAALNQQYPEFYVGHFDCVEEGRGILIGWERTTLTNPKCWR